MISYQLSSSQNVGPWDAEQLHYLPATPLNCLATAATGCTGPVPGPGSVAASTISSEGLRHIWVARWQCRRAISIVPRSQLLFGIVWNRGTGTGVQSFYKFNCALMSVNLRQADVIWEPDRPVRRAEERDRGLPEEKQTHGVTPPVSAETSCCMTKAMKFPIFAWTSSITELWWWQIGKSPNVCGAERLWKPAVWSRL